MVRCLPSRAALGQPWRIGRGARGRSLAEIQLTVAVERSIATANWRNPESGGFGGRWRSGSRRAGLLRVAFVVVAQVVWAAAAERRA
jgi:hypothetical protein